MLGWPPCPFPLTNKNVTPYDSASASARWRPRRPRLARCAGASGPAAWPTPHPQAAGSQPRTTQETYWPGHAARDQGHQSRVGLRHPLGASGGLWQTRRVRTGRVGAGPWGAGRAHGGPIRSGPHWKTQLGAHRTEGRGGRFWILRGKRKTNTFWSHRANSRARSAQPARGMCSVSSAAAGAQTGGHAAGRCSR